MTQDNPIKDLVDKAVLLTKEYRHEYITLEHLLAVLLEDEHVRFIIENLEFDPVKIHSNVIAFLENEIDTIPEESYTSPKKTVMIERVITRAYTQAVFHGRTSIDPLDLFISILSEERTAAYALLGGITREMIMSFVQNLTADMDTTEMPGIKIDKGEKVLHKFCDNLNKQASEGITDPIIGREEELANLTQTIARRKKNNVILVGESGVGKTAIAEGLAHLINENRVPDIIKDHTIYSLNVGALLAGTKFRGDFEERVGQLLDVIEKRNDIILFIDEIHMIMGAGSGGQGNMDIANMLKPVLQRGKLRCIGSTTYEEYRKTFEKDKALARRFYKVDITEPSVADAKRIVEATIPAYEKHHNISYTTESLHGAVDLTHQYWHNRKLPDKAFDVLDAAAARQQLVAEENRKTVLDLDDIRYEVAKMTSIPVDQLVLTRDSEYKQEKPIDIEKAISAKVYGQDEAIGKLANAIYIAKAGLKDANKPIGSYLFTGPTGVGKTETAKQLSETMSMELVRFDMSEYQEKHTIAKLIGAPPGYVGYGEGGQGSGLLVNKLEEHPNCILLLDEIEKAHPDVSNVLLQLMDNGMISNSQGKQVSARNAIVILTSNLGARNAEKNNIGFGDTENYTASEDAVNNFFSPEFRNRLDAIVNFSKLDKSLMKKVTEKFLTEVRDMLKPRDVTLSWSDDVIEWLTDKGFTPSMGARPMSRVINESIKTPLAKELLFGKDISTVKLGITNGKIDITTA